MLYNYNTLQQYSDWPLGGGQWYKLISVLPPGFFWSGWSPEQLADCPAMCFVSVCYSPLREKHSLFKNILKIPNQKIFPETYKNLDILYLGICLWIIFFCIRIFGHSSLLQPAPQRAALFGKFDWIGLTPMMIMTVFIQLIFNLPKPHLGKYMSGY